MAVRLKLKATLVRQLGTEELTDTLTAESFQRTLMVGADDDDGDGDGEVAHGSEDALPVVGDVVDDHQPGGRSIRRQMRASPESEDRHHNDGSRACVRPWPTASRRAVVFTTGPK